MSPEPKLSKAERLAIGTAVAGPVRQQARAPRKVTLVGKDGTPVGVTDSVEVAKSLLARSEIEFSVQDGKRPEFVNCKTCGRPVKVPPEGRVPTVCRFGTHSCACGNPIRSHGKCALGRKCKTCANKANGARFAIFSDDELRAALANVATFKDAADALGVWPGAIRARAKALKLTPGLAIHGEAPQAAGGRRAAAILNAKRWSGPTLSRAQTSPE
jgi:hypothetical protein